ncbi:hypothetical protein XalbCFBP2523_08540 [Xanthomonas albilineans]|nr:hypothetical protein XalbCFBP2523_08540 [Xanthomonas albilineans]
MPWRKAASWQLIRTRTLREDPFDEPRTVPGRWRAAMWCVLRWRRCAPPRNAQAAAEHRRENEDAPDVMWRNPNGKYD